MKNLAIACLVVNGLATSLVSAQPAAPAVAPTPQVAPTQQVPPTPQVAPTATTAPQPEPPQTYEEWARMYYQPMRVRKEDAVDLGNGRVRMLRIFSNQEFELLGEEGDFFVVRELPVDDPKSHLYKAMRRADRMGRYREARLKYFEDKYIITGQPDLTPPFTDRYEFVRVDKGLPTEGRWQMSFDVVDMNGDGRLDIVAPPPRLGSPKTPTIYLQQRDGSFTAWKDTVWPADARLDYGSVRVADFDRDGKLDIAIACHFAPSYILYGDGKGDFRRFVELPRANKAVTSRALAVADFDNDGRPDIALYAEVDVDITTSQVVNNGLVWLVLNKADGFKVVSGFPAQLHGDWLSVADLDGDGWTDLLLTTRKVSMRDLVFRNLGGGETFEKLADNDMPALAYVFANAVAPMDGFAVPDLVMCFEQFSPTQTTKPVQACVVYHFHDEQGRFTTKPTPVLLLKKEEEYNNIKGMAVGDIDGDGRNDLVLITVFGEVRILMQFPDGTFYEERSPEITLGETDPFDVKIVDLDGKGVKEIVIAGSPRGQGPGGGFFVFSPVRKTAKP